MRAPACGPFRLRAELGKIQRILNRNNNRFHLNQVIITLRHMVVLKLYFSGSAKTVPGQDGLWSQIALQELTFQPMRYVTKHEKSTIRLQACLDLNH